MSTAAALLATMLGNLLDRRTMPQLGPIPDLLDAADDRRFAAAFLLDLAGRSDTLTRDLLQTPETIPAFFSVLGDRVRAEVDSAAEADPALASALAHAADGVADFDDVWAATFPEGVGLRQDFSEAVRALRERRRVTVAETATSPIVDPVREILFTANVLVAGDSADFIYDHPIPPDSPAAATELAHGLRHLDSAVAFELERHPGWVGPLVVVLSVSSTSRSDTGEALEFVRTVIGDTGPYPHLRLHAFDDTGADAVRMAMLGDTAVASGGSVLGVSGPYGRHYSFLKFIAAIWSVCVDSDIKATFKIDLDQSFPQRRLVAETGASAFEHLTTPLWGASGEGSDGRNIELGLVAGGLVNSGDLDRSVFAPDVVAAPPETVEDVVFFSRLPQAVSTEAEICARAEDGVIERIHVTGGTNGIRVDSLRRWRLFVPSFVGRAEDQAYLLSGLGDPTHRPGYLHVPGLRMSHDKGDLIPGVIAQHAGAKHIGDLCRIRLFSALAARHKPLLDPFTGAFVSRLPVTVTALRLALHALALPAGAPGGYLSTAIDRLGETDEIVRRIDSLVAAEREEWHSLFDALDQIEAHGGPAAQPAASVQTVVSAARVG
ncbi:MAG: hypothetical protein QNJ81_09605 [Acidimicrobiia bacterium]|nr:hypothetical protein [Acidimicrobiia bacterium]